MITNRNNLDYTNKDFNSIYGELLDLCDTLSPKWKPSQSAESDPGVLMIKLDALLADKCNYIIDKNILELFPSSVTQYPNAREIFEQCGYIMPYYRAAEVDVAINIFNETTLAEEHRAFFPSDDNSGYRIYTIPRFTALTDKEAKCSYIMCESNDSASSDIKISSNNQITHIRCLEGSIKDLLINNSPKILYSSIDSNNRIYFPEINIAENGIFIFNYNADDSINYSEEWVQVDNLYVQSPLLKCYKFGVSKDTSKCYIEFPPNIANLISDGLCIKYILTSGAKGNIAARTLYKPLADIQAKIELVDSSGESADVILTANELHIINNFASGFGSDPETIDDAYRNYTATKNTFNTLVSLNDYNNFLKTSDIISNGVFTNRYNDILQDSYSIISFDSGVDREYIKEIKKTSDKDNMTPFDLKFYGFMNVDPVTTADEFNKTFKYLSSPSFNNLKLDMDDYKSIPHIISQAKNGLVGIFLDYTLSGNIIPYSKLSIIDQEEVLSNVNKALFKNLNASQLNFGERIPYDLVYDTIISSDDRIKALILENIEYTPKFVIADANLNITEYTAAQLQSSIYQDILNKCILAGVTPYYTFDKTVVLDALTSNAKKYSVDKISTNLELSIGGGTNQKSAEIELGANENLYLYLPHYVDDEQYTNYVKYYANFSNVPANTLYQLGSEDKIGFFWSDSSESGAPYNYEIYGPGTIISSSIICGNNNFTGDKPAGIDNIFSNLTAESGTISAGDTYKAIKELRGNYILSAGKTIATKKVYETKFKNNPSSSDKDFLNISKAYWILNNQIAGKYQLKSPYILQPGEYFFYASSDNSKFVQLGSGYEIKFKPDIEQTTTKPPRVLEVDARSYADVMISTTELFDSDDLWYKLTDNDEFTCTEMEFINLGEGCTVTFNSVSDLPEIIFNNAGIHKLPADASGIPNDITISYQYKDESAKTLTNLDIGEVMWNGRTILNLNTSPTKAQELKNGRHSLTYNNKGSTVNIEPSGSLGANETYYIKSSYEASLLGGKDIDVAIYDVYGNKSNLDIVAYTKSDALEIDSNDLKYRLTDSIIEINIAADTNKAQTITGFSYSMLSTGSVLIPIHLSEDVNIAIIATNSSNTVTLPNPSSTKSHKGMNYYKFSKNSDTFNISIPAKSPDFKLQVFPPQLIKSTEEVGSNFNTIAANKFDYSWIPRDDELISKPFDGNSLLDEHHPYNKHVLCRWNLSESNNKLSITNNIR